MSLPLPTVERAREFLSRRAGRVVSPEAAREATEDLVGLFRLLLEWDRRLRADAPEFETGELRGVAGIAGRAYAPPR